VQTNTKTIAEAHWNRCRQTPKPVHRQILKLVQTNTALIAVQTNAGSMVKNGQLKTTLYKFWKEHNRSFATVCRIKNGKNWLEIQ
jgi:hypothetical protein